MRDEEYTDARLVDIYDLQGPWGPDDRYFAALVDEMPGSRVLDLGCGTGRLGVALAAGGHLVTGIDPAAASLAAARTKPGAGRVIWIEGTAGSAPAAAFDIALMTGHVAQFFVGDEQWSAALRALHRALVPGGRLAFNAYDPAARVWDHWTPEKTRRALTLPDGATVSIWTDVTRVLDDTVSYSHHYAFADGSTRRSDSTLRFRSESSLRETLTAAGFRIERIDGGWRGQAVGRGDGELILVARRLSNRRGAAPI